MTALAVIGSLACAYALTLAAWFWWRSGADRVDDLLHAEHRDHQPSAVVSVFAALNPAYRWRRYSDDEPLVTRTFTDSRSALADESR